MLDKAVLEKMIDEYKAQLSTRLEKSDCNKWRAVKHFQDNWDIDATDFATMLKEALKYAYGVTLDTENFHLFDKIAYCAKKNPEETRQMFVDLFNDSDDCVERVIAFRKKSEELFGDKYKQNVKAITQYLWLHDPKEYYICREEDLSEANKILGAGYKIAKRSTKNIEKNLQKCIDFSKELNNELEIDAEIRRLLDDKLNEDCDKDDKLHTLTYDFIQFLSENKKQKVLKTKIEEYKKAFPTWLTKTQPANSTLPDVPEREKQKWVAVKHFKDNWKPEATKFGAMLEDCLSVDPMLIETGDGQPDRQIKDFAEEQPAEAKQMFDDLFDDTKGYVERVMAFAEKANGIWKEKNKQSKRVISQYLWRYDPNKYYPYSDDLKEACGILGDIFGVSNEFVNKRAKSDVLWTNFLSFFEKLNNELNKEDYKLKQLLKDNLTDFYEYDKKLHTLTYDFMHFIALKSAEEKSENSNGKGESKMGEYKVAKNRILYGAPGTGKTYSTRKEALSIIKKTEIKELTQDLANEFNRYQKEGQIVFTTFHQSYSYEDFIEGLKPIEDKESPLGYKLGYKPGVFFEIAEKARGDAGNNYVIIIDEINRGQISKIFGELITLIEDDKREGKDNANALSVILPSGKPFSVPENLYIIGTMNTADKSISLIDVALRRRFEFVEKAPDADLVNKDFTGFFNELNERLKGKFKSTDLLIGHAYFMGDNVDFCSVMNNKVIPLLYEYYFDDRDKIEEVLGESLKATKLKYQVSDTNKFERLKVVKKSGGQDA